MTLLSLADPLFLQPFVTGLIFAVALPVLGMYLRLREEWLAALSFAQLAAAGSLAAAIVELPVVAGGLIVSCAAAAFKSWLSRGGNNGYAVLMVAGWGAAVLMLANVPAADHVGHALFDGQLYFTGASNLWSAAGFAVVGGLALAWLNRPLLLERVFPDFYRASGQSARHFHLLFDFLVAAGLALATASIGVMAAFALVFVPTMVAYQWGRNWRRSLGIAVGVSGVAYVVAFQTALMWDQPFGPVLVIGMTLVASCGWALHRLLHRTARG